MMGLLSFRIRIRMRLLMCQYPGAWNRGGTDGQDPQRPKEPSAEGSGNTKGQERAPEAGSPKGEELMPSLTKYVPRCRCGRGSTYFIHHSKVISGRHISNEPRCSIVKLHCRECCNA